MSVMRGTRNPRDTKPVSVAQAKLHEADALIDQFVRENDLARADDEYYLRYRGAEMIAHEAAHDAIRWQLAPDTMLDLYTVNETHTAWRLRVEALDGHAHMNQHARQVLADGGLVSDGVVDLLETRGTEHDHLPARLRMSVLASVVRSVLAVAGGRALGLLLMGARTAPACAKQLTLTNATWDTLFDALHIFKSAPLGIGVQGGRPRWAIGCPQRGEMPAPRLLSLLSPSLSMSVDFVSALPDGDCIPIDQIDHLAMSGVFARVSIRSVYNPNAYPSIVPSEYISPDFIMESEDYDISPYPDLSIEGYGPSLVDAVTSLYAQVCALERFESQIGCHFPAFDPLTTDARGIQKR